MAVALAMIWPVPVDPEKLPAAFHGSDLPLSHWPNALLIKRTVADEGELPLWNPHYGGGRPVAADPLAALWYPPSHLVHLLSPHDYFVVILVLHLVLAGAGMLLLARYAFGLSRIAALVASVAYMLTPRLIAHMGAGHITMTMAVAWLPWCVLALWLTVRQPGRWWVALAGSCAMLLLAGHPQLAVYGALLLLAVGGWLLIGRWRAAGREAAIRSAAGLAAAGVTAVLISAVHLLPLLEFTEHSTRQDGIRTTDATTAWIALKALAGFSIPSDLPHEAMFDPGLSVLLLALVGAVVWRQRMLPIVVGIAAVFWLALGVDSLLFKLTAAIIPEFDRFRGAARIWFIALIGIGLLAGAGVEAIRRSVDHRNPRLGTGLASIILAGVTIHLISVGHGLTRVDKIEPYVTANEVTNAIVAAADGGRIYGIQRNVNQGSAVMLDVELVDGQDPLLIASHTAFMERAGNYVYDDYQLSVPPFEVYEPEYDTYQYPDPNPRLLALLGVTVVASWFPIEDPLLNEVAYIENNHIYRLQTASSRAWYVPAASAASELSVGDIQETAVPVTSASLAAERASFTIDAPDDGIVVLGWPPFPGWHAYLDGERVDVETIDGWLPAVRVSEGTHRLIWTYEPASVAIGKGLSVAGLLIAGCWIAARALSPRRRSNRRHKARRLSPRQPSAAG